MRVFVLQLISILFLFQATAQVNEKRVKIISPDGLGVPFAHVYVQNNISISTISNKEGLFLLNGSLLSKDDQVVISHVGYQSKEIPFNDLDSIVSLNFHEIPEVAIYPFQANELILKVTKKIEQSYFSKTYNAKGFYREVMLEDDEGVLAGELAFNSLIESNPSKGDRIEVINGRKSEDFRSIKSELIFWIPEILANEPSRTRKEFLSKEGVKSYDYKILGRDYYEGKEIYKLSFASKACDSCKNIPSRKGVIRVDVKNFSILEIEYDYDKNHNIPLLKEKLIGLNRVAGTNLKTTFKIKYKNYKNNYYPFFYDVKTEFIFANEGKAITTTFLLKMIINEVNFGKLESVKNNYRSEKGLQAQAKMKFDNEFKNPTAYIIPSLIEEKAIEQILSRK